MFTRQCLCRTVKLPWVFPGAPLNSNGAPGNIHGTLNRYASDRCQHFFQGLKHDKYGAETQHGALQTRRRHVDYLVQDWSICIAIALEILCLALIHQCMVDQSTYGYYGYILVTHKNAKGLYFPMYRYPPCLYIGVWCVSVWGTRADQGSRFGWELVGTTRPKLRRLTSGYGLHQLLQREPGVQRVDELNAMYHMNIHIFCYIVLCLRCQLML